MGAALMRACALALGTVTAPGQAEEPPVRQDDAWAALERALTQLVHAELAYAVSERAFFPLDAGSLQPGAFNTVQVRGLDTPLFVIGLDDASLAWLEDNAAELRELSARGLVVAGGDYAAYEALRRAAADTGLAVEAAPGEALAVAYGLKTYPALLVPAR